MTPQNFHVDGDRVCNHVSEGSQKQSQNVLFLLSPGSQVLGDSVIMHRTFGNTPFLINIVSSEPEKIANCRHSQQFGAFVGNEMKCEY
jgi:hypothetical protein